MDADSDHIGASVRLGVCYPSCRAVTTDYSREQELLKQAHVAGHANLTRSLGLIDLEGHVAAVDHSRALDLPVDTRSGERGRDWRRCLRVPQGLCRVKVWVIS